MAIREQKKQPASPPCIFLSLLIAASLLLAFSLFSQTTTYDSKPHYTSASSNCNYSDGRWIYDPTAVKPRYDDTCKEIFKGWNCIGSNKENAWEIVKWRWKPYGCDLPHFDPISFLHRFRDTNIESG